MAFSVKLQFGKTLVLLQNEFVFEKEFRCKIFFFPKMFGSKTYISSKKNFEFKKFWVKKIWGSNNFELRIFLVQAKYESSVILSPKNFFRTNIFFGPKFIFGLKFFLNHHSFSDQFFWDQNIFGTKIFLGPNFFWNQKFLGTKVLLGLRLQFDNILVTYETLFYLPVMPHQIQNTK